MKYIFIKIKESANLNLSIDDELKSLIEKYKSDIDFIEYHSSDDEEQNYIDYLE